MGGKGAQIRGTGSAKMGHLAFPLLCFSSCEMTPDPSPGQGNMGCPEAELASLLKKLPWCGGGGGCCCGLEEEELTGLQGADNACPPSDSSQPLQGWPAA